MFTIISKLGRDIMNYNIKKIRKEQKITQQKLSEISGISRTTIALLETGRKKETSTKTLLAIANALGVSVESLFFLD